MRTEAGCSWLATSVRWYVPEATDSADDEYIDRKDTGVRIDSVDTGTEAIIVIVVIEEVAYDVDATDAE